MLKRKGPYVHHGFGPKRIYRLQNFAGCRLSVTRKCIYSVYFERVPSNLRNITQNRFTTQKYTVV